MGKLKKSSKQSEPQPATETSPAFGFHPSRAELYQMGRACARNVHAPHMRPGNPPPIGPTRLSSWRNRTKGAFRSNTPATGLRVQCCGDAHLLNFGAYATPERRVIFDVNDLDETLPAPWEWDVKRLAASFVLACRNNGFSADVARDAALSCVRSYREHMAEFSDMRTLDVWYASIDMEKLIPTIQDEEARKRAKKRLEKARARTVVEHDFPEMVYTTGLAPTIKENPPLIYHRRELGHEEEMENVRNTFARYRESLAEHRRLLLDRYKLRDIAIKVVGVGSVGTTCFVILMMASDTDPLFMQVKEARPSVLEAYAGQSAYPNHGQRVVIGCRLMQSASDLFLGWTQGVLGRHFYLRQLKDMKIKMLVEIFTQSVMLQYAGLCGWCLARAHARSGEPAKISGYLGKSDAFDKALADFSIAYADQSERDHEVLMKAVRAGKLEVFIEQNA